MNSSSSKPYRVYHQPRRVRGDGSIPWHEFDGHEKAPKPPRSQRVPWRAFKYVRRALYVVIAIALVWSGIAYWSFRSAVKERNALVPANVATALDPTNGPMLSSAQNILLLGTDTRPGSSEAGRSDSIILMRMDVKRRRYAMLSIPRDMRVSIDGLGQEKINSAFSNGGAALTIKTVSTFTGVDINHYILIDFSGFKTLVDEIGGIDLYNPTKIRSNSFDGKSWFFPKGEIHLRGRKALAYARVRKNQLDPGESDLTRGLHQQAVLNAIANKIVSMNSVLHPKGVPHAVVQPLITELSANELITAGFGKAWARNENVLNCRLGGDIEYINGQSMIVGSEDNRATIRMWLGEQPPRRPNTTVNQFAPGCIRASDTSQQGAASR